MAGRAVTHFSPVSPLAITVRRMSLVPSPIAIRGLERRADRGAGDADGAGRDVDAPALQRGQRLLHAAAFDAAEQRGGRHAHVVE